MGERPESEEESVRSRRGSAGMTSGIGCQTEMETFSKEAADDVRTLEESIAAGEPTAVRLPGISAQVFGIKGRNESRSWIPLIIFFIITGWSFTETCR